MLSAIGLTYEIAAGRVLAPYFGTSLLTWTTVIATVLGGLGSLGGAVLGGFVVGAAEVLTQAFLPAAHAPYRDAVVLSGVIALLVLRPDGLIPPARVDRS